MDTKITCIEPHPFPKLDEIKRLDLIVSEVQSVPLEKFKELQSGDVLFIDSSHVVRIDGDVPFLILEVLPILASGVYVHIHDMPLPYNTPFPADYWTLLRDMQSPHWPMYWNEAMLVQAFLAFNHEFEVVLSTPIIRHHDAAFLAANLPIYISIAIVPNTFSSLWLRRK